MIATREITYSRIACGAARDENRRPTHDGEYLALYYVPGETEWLLENNGGLEATDDEPRPDGSEEDPQWEAILHEAEMDMACGTGTPAVHCGGEASGCMVEMGWLKDDGETHHIHREGGA